MNAKALSSIMGPGRCKLWAASAQPCVALPIAPSRSVQRVSHKTRPSHAFFAVAFVWFCLVVATLAFALNGDTALVLVTGIPAGVGGFWLARWQRRGV